MAHTVGMHWTVVEADRHRASDVFAEHDDGGFGAWAWWLGVRVVGTGGVPDCEAITTPEPLRAMTLPNSSNTSVVP